MNSQTFGERLKALRLKLNYSLEEAGKLIGYTPNLLSMIERNKKKVPVTIIKTLSEVYACSFKELMLHYLSENIYYQLRGVDCAEEVLEIVERRLKEEGKNT